MSIQEMIYVQVGLFNRDQEGQRIFNVNAGHISCAILKTIDGKKRRERYHRPLLNLSNQNFTDDVPLLNF
jgi:hypothetical protein